MRRSLNEIIRSETIAALDDGLVQPGVLAKEIAERYSDELHDEARRLLLRSISEAVRDVLREAASTYSAEPLLFPELGEDVPRAICVPGAANGKPAYVAMRRATVTQLRAAAELRAKQIADDTKHWRTLMHLLSLCEAHGLRDDDRLTALKRPDAA